jgi:hypothetical protein
MGRPYMSRVALTDDLEQHADHWIETAGGNAFFD